MEWEVIPIKKALSLFLCAVMIGQLCSCSGGGRSVTILTNGEEVLATVSSADAATENEHKAYLQLVLDEAVGIIADVKGIDETKASKQLYRGGYTIYTAYDAQVSDRLTAACDELTADMDAAAVITDTEGWVCAVYSNHDGDTNFATAQYPPCSAIKPISVYAPAVEEGIIDWFTRYEDSPYLYLTNADGTRTPWPSNANNVYSHEQTFISRAVKESTNTIAVKCLSDYGVLNSISFMEQHFGISLETEKSIATGKGEDEIIGNIALGSFVDGVSPVDMAGYYQVFANGGLYQAPRTITKICDKAGTEIYTAAYDPAKVLTRSTSATMNYLLQEVVSAGGTGKDAACRGIKVAGKTGTDDDYKNNWFVAVTPEYCCSFWHGRYTSNVTTQLFSAAMTRIYEDKTDAETDFPHLRSVRQVAFCPESGKQYTASCPSVEMGYCLPDQPLSRCDQH